MESPNDIDYDAHTKSSDAAKGSKIKYCLGSKQRPLIITFDLSKVTSDEMIHQTSQNTGHILWDSSYIMGNWLALHGRKKWQSNLVVQKPAVLELGCGLGLCSLVRLSPTLVYIHSPNYMYIDVYVCVYACV